MAISSASLAVANDALFGDITPVIDAIRKLGAYNFTDGAPAHDVKPGATVKVQIQAVAAAAAFNTSTNNYLTGGTTGWATLTASHYLQGFDVGGADLDSGHASDIQRIRQNFTLRAGKCIAAAIQGNLKAALDGATLSTGVTLAAAASMTYAQIAGLASGVAWLNREDSVLAVNGTEMANIRRACAADNLAGTPTELAQYLGFRDLLLVPGMTARGCIVPSGSVGFLSAVPTPLANFLETGTETDEATGLSIGVVVANDQALNRIVVNADLWFGTALVSANAGASTAGVIKYGTAT